MARSTIRTRRWTRTEYDRAIECGIFHEDEPLELLRGRLIVAEPQSDPHARGIEAAAEALRAGLGPGWRVRVQLPLALGATSEPEPDISVVRGSHRDAPRGHPSRADLIVEVARDSLRLDRGLKASIYAEAGVRDYWIINVRDAWWRFIAFREWSTGAGRMPIAALRAPVRRWRRSPRQTRRSRSTISCREPRRCGPRRQSGRCRPRRFSRHSPATVA